ncbi:hypothetical protein L1987_05678 [Smallanthus sonchifolius]|uniref:Uncharacterized protein n=1 Tax=Smallanthus sonchifolius TaxID=185202 RepID=A0ACB9JW63_9ASTR|nr:hypothetical protein L1987_05678 [Smallanthus sonchifolius]
MQETSIFGSEILLQQSQAGIAVRAGLNHNLLGIAVRAVLLESGFVEIDPISKSLNSDKFNFQGNWYLASFYYSSCQDKVSKHRKVLQSLWVFGLWNHGALGSLRRR